MFAHPLGLLALLALPAIVALHLFRRRFQPYTVSALFLWAPEDRTPLSGRKRERLRSSLSLWSELAAALLFALALAGPRGCTPGDAAHLVVVLDASASLGATTTASSGDGHETLRDRAVALVSDRMADLPRGSRVTLIASGAPPVVLAGPAAFVEEARAKLDAFTPGARGHDLGPALALAEQLARGHAVLVASDHDLTAELPAEAELVSIGAPLDNVAITHAARSVERDPATGSEVERVFVTVTSFSRAREEARLSVRTAGTTTPQAVDPHDLELEPGAHRSLAFDLAPGAPTVEVVLELARGADALAIDDRAFLAPAPPRTLALHCALPDDVAVRLGLASGRAGGARADRWLALVPASVEVDDASAAHLVITDATGARGGPTTWVLAIEAPGSERRDLVGPFLLEKRHPLLEGITLEGVVWSADPAHRPPGAPLVSAGSDPLLVEDVQGAKRVVTLSLDPARSSLDRSPDWPILLANLAEARRRELPGPERTSLVVGDDFVFRSRGAFSPEETLVLEGAGLRRELPARLAIVVGDLDAPGSYVLRRGNAVLAEIAVRFADPAESDLRDLGPVERPAQATLASVARGSSSIEALLAAAALAFVLADWLVLARAGPLFVHERVDLRPAQARAGLRPARAQAETRSAHAQDS